MNCKVIVNAESGNYNRLDLDKLLQNLGCAETEIEIIRQDADWSADGYDTVIVCGGDGTLHNALSKCSDKKIVYAPCGTLNETARTETPITSVGKINDEFFSYVCAAGSFTEIGYLAKNKNKKRFKAAAYLPQILKSYRCREIDAAMDVDGKKISDKYTLIMVLKSNRCFGFKFNKSYNKNKGLYLLTVKSFGKDTLLNRIKMFAPFFRVFFMGVKEPQVNKMWSLVPFNELTLTLKEPQTFCVDGEKRVFGGKLTLSAYSLEKEITVVKTPFTARKQKSNSCAAPPKSASNIALKQPNKA